MCGLSANLGCRSETCCTRLAENAGAKNRQEFAIWAPSNNFVGLSSAMLWKRKKLPRKRKSIFNKSANVESARNVGQCPTWWSLCRIQVAPSVQRRKVWLTPTTRCCAVTLSRRETSWNLQGCPKLFNRSQPLVGRSSPYCEDMWRRYRCFTSVFPIVDTCLSCEDIARQICAMVPRWRFLATFLCPLFQRAACSTFRTCILNSH